MALSFSCVMVGSETLLEQCARQVLQRGHQIQAIVSDNPDLIAFAQKNGLRAVPPGPGLESRIGAGFDWLLSVANLALLPDGVLQMAQKGAVNFHDGPLPRYAGLNAPVWALLKGEAQHGISWHLIEPGVDKGDLVRQVLFPIHADDTAFSLNARCFATAIDSFPAVLDALEAGIPERHRQDFSQRSLFRRDDRPQGHGRIDFGQPAQAVARLVRALDHGGYWNPLCLPKLESAAGLFAVEQAQVLADTGPAGQVLAVDGDGLVVACGEGSVKVTGLRCLNGLPADPRHVAHPGESLVQRDPAQVDQQLAPLLAGEGHWRRALAGFVATDLPGTRTDGTGALVQVPLPKVSFTRAAAILGFFARRLGGGGLGLATQASQNTHANAPAEVAAWLPWMPEGHCLADIEGSLSASLDFALRWPGYPRDLIARDPALGPMRVPDLAVSASSEPVQGAMLCVTAGKDGACLWIDSTRLSAEETTLFSERLQLLAEVDGEQPLETLPVLTSYEKALITRINATETDFDTQATLARLFETQVARNPEAPALVFEDQTLSYAELNKRANQTAHLLQAMGVGPDVPVALFTRRSPDMLIGALAILKAGGAYVPMDPAYPSDRLAHFLQDSGAPVIVTQSDLAAELPSHDAMLLILDTDERQQDMPESNPESGAGPENLAYLIYTSGSTGKPKGVMVEHRNVVNFFTGMDTRIRHDPPGVWLAVTSLSFDISVLELFWTLARGFKLVLTSDEDRMMVSGGTIPVSDQRMDFSLFYWGNDDGPGPRKYELLLEGARFADTNGFCAVWTPERHFHAFGGPYPNPAVTGAAVAAVTRNLAVRAGSCVAPLHHPLRIAEEWAVIDNLTNGRTGLGIASGWHPVDFVLRPENAPPNNKTAMFETIETLRRLWRGDEVTFDRAGQPTSVQSLPRPVSKELPLWLTIAGNPETWREAGRIGAHVLTHLLGQSIPEVAEKIKLYHAALREAGHDPADFTVTLMLHTYVASTRDEARETAREPMKRYLQSAAGLVQQYAWAFPAFKRPAGATSAMDIDLRSLSEDEVSGVLDYAFNRYFEESGLFGTVEDCVARVEQLKSIGISEIACLIDYGIATDQVLAGLRPLAEVLKRSNQPGEVPEGDYSIAAQILRHKVTHLQCTPSMARMLLTNTDSRRALARVNTLLIGGEALPGGLAAELSEQIGAPVQNMYGPTETTIWSTTTQTRGGQEIVDIGTPIANTALFILDETHRPVPLGEAGELWIGGAGVTRGYWKQPEMTAARFITNPFGPGRLYGTGDRVRLHHDGRFDFLGRADHQVKIRGYRIELGEIESALDQLPGVVQSVVLAREDTPGDARLVAYFTGTAQGSDLRQRLAAQLPAHMVPAHFVMLPSFPLTPNKKIDRKQLPAPVPAAIPPSTPVIPDASAGASDTMDRVATIWRSILGVSEVRPGDNFFALGGHSLLAVQAHREIREQLMLPGLSITDVFRFPVLSALCAHIDTRFGKQTPPPAAPAEGAAQSRRDAVARRRALRSERLGRTG